MKTGISTRRNFLKRISLVGIVSGVAGCSNDEYIFDGVIDGEKIKYSHADIWGSYDLKIIKPNGIKIIYKDFAELGKTKRFVDMLIVETKNEKKIYKRDKIGKPILGEAQRQYIDYLNKILKEKEREDENKQKEGLNLIKK